MQVQRISSNNYNTNFKANIVDSGALRNFQSGLNGKEKKLYNSFVDVIKNSKDKNNYVFEYINIGFPSKLKRIASISIRNRDKSIQRPAIFADKAENALNLFKKLAERCKKAE